MAIGRLSCIDIIIQLLVHCRMKRLAYITMLLIILKVNVPFDLCEALKPSSLVTLGQNIGKVAVSLAGGKVTKVTVSTLGSEMKSHRYLTAAVCIGILSKPEVNLVNAMALAKASGFEVCSS